jgi:glutaredoxin
MTKPAFVDRIAEWLHRYGLIIVGISALIFFTLDISTSKQLFDSSGERATFFRSVAKSETRVLLLVTEWCPACKSLESDLAAEQISFTRIDVEQSQPGASLFAKAAQRTGSQGVPKVIVDDNLIRPSVYAVRKALEPPTQ